MTQPDFSAFGLPEALLRGLDVLGYATPTAVQADSLPPILQGRDLLARAPTGSGKTAAFGLGLLARLDLALNEPQALVLCPTRELADQVARQLRKLATALPNLKVMLLYGGTALAPQLASLAQHAPHVVVGTPGRVQELLAKRALSLRALRTLVLDEADRMLDMGFEDALRDIVRRTPSSRQTLLFSATFPDEVRAAARGMLREPVEVSVEGVDEAPRIEELFVDAAAASKVQSLATVLLQFRPESCVVFCNMRRDVDEVAGSLAHFGFSALALHGDMEQRDREEVLIRFANRSCQVLVASDVAARGLDVHELGAVVNYDVPTDADTYVHRIGRTGRAGREGLAITLCTLADRARLERIEAVRRDAGNTAPLAWRRIPPVAGRPTGVPQAAMATLRIDAGKTDKLRPGDIVGALTGEAGLPVAAVGKIDVFPTRSYVAIERRSAARALERLRAGRIKGKRFRVSAL